MQKVLDERYKESKMGNARVKMFNSADVAENNIVSAKKAFTLIDILILIVIAFIAVVIIRGYMVNCSVVTTTNATVKNDEISGVVKESFPEVVTCKNGETKDKRGNVYTCLKKGDVLYIDSLQGLR